MPRFCPTCGSSIREGDSFCHNCGAQLSQAVTQPQVSVYVQGTVGVQRTSGFAVASFVLGILGFSILAVIFGAIAISQTGKDPNLSGRGFAIAGLVLGLIELTAGLIILVAIFAFGAFGVTLVW